jgi:hypothetical protein
MKKDHAVSKLHRRIKEEEQRTKQYAGKVRISRFTALDLAGMEAADWHEASNGWTELEQCKVFASEFNKRGEMAANGLKLSVVGPVLEVSTDPDAPDVEITQGIPFESRAEA